MIFGYAPAMKCHITISPKIPYTCHYRIPFGMPIFFNVPGHRTTSRVLLESIRTLCRCPVLNINITGTSKNVAKRTFLRDDQKNQQASL